MNKKYRVFLDTADVDSMTFRDWMERHKVTVVSVKKGGPMDDVTFEGEYIDLVLMIATFYPSHDDECDRGNVQGIYEAPAVERDLQEELDEAYTRGWNEGWDECKGKLLEAITAAAEGVNKGD